MELLIIIVMLFAWEYFSSLEGGTGEKVKCRLPPIKKPILHEEPILKKIKSPPAHPLDFQSGEIIMDVALSDPKNPLALFSRIHYAPIPVVDAGGVKLYLANNGVYWIRCGDNPASPSIPINKLLGNIVMGGVFHRALRKARKNGLV
jgi:hypothetical protein